MSSACPRLQAEPAPRLRLREADAGSRAGLQQFIARRFAEVYEARLYSFMPRLFGLYADSGALLAAFGLRTADREPLFLERYLDTPIEAQIADRYGRRVPRQRIVEVGNLAGVTPGAVRELILLLCEQLYVQGFRWVAFTGAARLCNSFTRMGLPLQVIAPAPVERLSAEERRLWGRYYERSPAVMLGDIGGGRRQLRAAATAAGPNQLLAPLAGVVAP